jgi:hypothetical protein
MILFLFVGFQLVPDIDPIQVVDSLSMTVLASRTPKVKARPRCCHLDIYKTSK